jgi:hypothetical protein
MSGEPSSREIYDQWYELYYLLSTLELDRREPECGPCRGNGSAGPIRRQVA